MKNASRIVAIVALLNSLAAISHGQTVAKDSSASISGRITIAGKGAADISVIASITTSYDARAVAKATTDDEGNYRINGLTTGRVTISPVAKRYAISSREAARGQPGRMINVLAGEEITKIDFELIPGGVVTGRITDLDGSPIIGEPVNVLPVDTKNTAFVLASFEGQRNSTDDRGIYRIYGLVPGKYKVSVGQATPQGSNAMFRGGSQYLQTYYPGVQDESKATIIEIREGSEVKDVDIKTTKGARGFSAAGRVVDSISGKPMSNVFVGYSLIQEPNKHIGGMSFAASPTDANGKFSLEGLQPGHYTTFTMGIGAENSSYSEQTKFEIIDANVSGIEIKVSRGATIGGFAVIENNPDPALAAALPTINLYSYVERQPGSPPSFARGKINADGSFRFSGLAPGKVRIMMQEFPKPPKGLTLSRVEHNGVDQREGIEVTEGAEINDVRLVFSYGEGSIRGTVKVVGGTVPEGAMFWVMLSGGSENNHGLRRHIEVDSRGRFTMENIPPATYELILSGSLGRQELPGFKPVKQTVTITNGVETQVTIEVDLAANKARPD